jgi:hypothetical protein
MVRANAGAWLPPAYQAIRAMLRARVSTKDAASERGATSGAAGGECGGSTTGHRSVLIRFAGSSFHADPPNRPDPMKAGAIKRYRVCAGAAYLQ